MKDLISLGIIGHAYSDMRFFQEREASEKRENYKKYATTKKASLKRKKKIKKVVR